MISQLCGRMTYDGMILFNENSSRKGQFSSSVNLMTIARLQNVEAYMGGESVERFKTMNYQTLVMRLQRL